MSTSTASWSEVPLKRLLRYVDERVQLEDMREYITITVRRRHGGLEERERLFGHQIKTKKQFRLVPGSLIISRIQCWHQAYALVPDTIPPNMIASSNYDQFAISQEVDRRFFWWLTHSPRFTQTVRSSAVGVVIEKMVFDREAWLEKTMPLPPLAEQQRIVARIEALAARIEEAHGLRQCATDEAEKLHPSALSSLMEPHGSAWKRETVGDVIVRMDAGWSPQCDDFPARDGEWGVLKTTSVQWCKFYPMENKALPTSLAPIPELCVQEGDVLVTRAGPRKRVGVVAAVHKTEPRLTISDKLIRLRPDKTKVDPRFLELALASPFSQEHLVHRKTGLADAQVNISQPILRATPIAYPPLPDQRRIVAYLDGLQAKVDALKTRQAETAAELDALLPSILDKAFRGEL